MVAIGENIILTGQVGTAAIDQINAGQIIFQRDFLRAKMLLYGHGIVRSTLDRRIVGDNHAFNTRYAPNAGNDASSRHIFVTIHAVCGQLR